MGIAAKVRGNVEGLLVRLIATTVAALVASALLGPYGLFAVGDLLTAVVFAAVLGVLNAIVKPILVLLTCPLLLLTLGLFSLILNTVILLLAAWVVPNVYVSGFGGAFLAAIIIGAINVLASFLFKDHSD
jgi:putative membrane protein